MRRPLNRLFAVLGLGAVASQAGHLIAYQLEYGSSAWAVQSHGAHAYFPLLARTGLGIAAFVLLGGALIVGAARLASGRRVRVTTGPSLMALVSSLFTVQLTFFAVQETIESLVAGSPAPHFVALLFVGAIGQLPVAAAAALAVRWLATRLETAVVSLRVVLTTSPVVALPAVVVLARPQPVLQVALADACPASFVKRGPPVLLRG